MLSSKQFCHDPCSQERREAGTLKISLCKMGSPGSFQERLSSLSSPINSSSHEYIKQWERQRLSFLLGLLPDISPPTTDHSVEFCRPGSQIQNELVRHVELHVMGWSILVSSVKPHKLIQPFREVLPKLFPSEGQSLKRSKKISVVTCVGEMLDTVFTLHMNNTH